MDVQGLVVQVAAALAGATSLHIFYRAVKTDWPVSYMSASDFVSHLVSASLLRYTLYRSVPVFAVSFFIAGSMHASGRAPAFAALAAAMIHVVATNGIAAAETIHRGRRRFGFYSKLAFHGAAGIAAVGAALLAIGLSHVEGLLVLLPTLQEISSTLWTAVIAAVLGAYIVRTVARVDDDPVARSRASIPDALWSSARTHAIVNGADPVLVKAIMVVENLQRPRWLRALERLKGRLGLPGTFGLMQLSSSVPLDDEESIRLATEGYLRGVRLDRDRHAVNLQTAKEIVQIHNPDPAFVEFVLSAIWAIENEEAALRARIEILDGEGSVIRIRNTGTSDAEDCIVYRIDFTTNPPQVGRSHATTLPAGSSAVVGEFAACPATDLPPTETWEWPANGPQLIVLRATWCNEDMVAGDSGWRAF